MNSTGARSEPEVRPRRGRGDNLYPQTFTETCGELVLELDVPEGVWNPTPHGLHLANMLLRLDFTGMHVLELGTGSGLHAILLARRGAARMTLTEIEPAISANARHNPRPQRHQDPGGVRHRRLDGGAGCIT